MNIEKATLDVLVLEAARDEFAARANAIRASLNAAAVAEFAEKRSAVSWRPPDLGTWSQGISKDAAVVTDPAVFVAWCKERYPNAVIEHVVPVFEKALLKRLSPVGEEVVDPTTGELVPGVGVRRGGAPLTLQFRAESDAKAVADQHAAPLVGEVLSKLGITDAPD